MRTLSGRTVAFALAASVFPTFALLHEGCSTPGHQGVCFDETTKTFVHYDVPSWASIGGVELRAEEAASVLEVTSEDVIPGSVPGSLVYAVFLSPQEGMPEDKVLVMAINPGHPVQYWLPAGMAGVVDLASLEIEQTTSLEVAGSVARAVFPDPILGVPSVTASYYAPAKINLENVSQGLFGCAVEVEEDLSSVLEGNLF